MKKTTIGREVSVDIEGIASGIPAKVDTGADGSAIWASRIRMDKEGYLHFYLFDKSSPLYTGQEIVTKDYTVTEVKSASGHVLIKFCPYFKIKLAGKTIRVRFGLSDRSKHRYPILIGRRTISGKFLVDVSKDEGLIPLGSHRSDRLRDELEVDPYEFYKKYYLKED